jgi:hypothetical protein
LEKFNEKEVNEVKRLVLVFLILVILVGNGIAPCVDSNDKYNYQNKPRYLILVNKEADKILYQDFIYYKEAHFDVEIIALEEKGIGNKLDPIVNFLRGELQQKPFQYLLLDEAIYYPTIATQGTLYGDYRIPSDQEYIRLLSQDNPKPKIVQKVYEHETWVPKFYIGRMLRKQLKFYSPSQRLENLNLLSAFPYFFFPVDEYGKPIVYGGVTYSRRPIYDFSYLSQWVGQKVAKFMTEHSSVISLSENRCEYSSVIDLEAENHHYKGDGQLAKENFLKYLPDANLLVTSTTGMPLASGKTSESEANLIPTTYSKVITAIWKDDNEDLKAQNTEIQTEEIFDFNFTANTQTLAFIPLLVPPQDFPFSNMICPYWPDKTRVALPPVFVLGAHQPHNPKNIFHPEKNLFFTPWLTVLDGLFKGESIGEAVDYLFTRFCHQLLDWRYADTEYFCLMFNVLGDPSVTILDLIKQAEIKIEPEITLERFKNNIFTIENRGDKELRFEIQNDNSRLEFSQKQGVIKPQDKIEIQIQIKEPFFAPLALLKPKRINFRILSNDRQYPDIEIRTTLW